MTMPAKRPEGKFGLALVAARRQGLLFYVSSNLVNTPNVLTPGSRGRFMISTRVVYGSQRAVPSQP